MQAFTKLTGRMLVLEQENIDTDQIIPARFLTATDFDGIGDHAFAYWRFDTNGKPITGHRLNQPGAHDSPILVAGHNFGCGSSREHAPFALEKAGIKAIIAESYARIFYRNAVDGGFVVPLESEKNLVSDIKTGDQVELNFEASTLENKRTGSIYTLKSPGTVLPIIEAGGLFNFARNEGMI
jgi:3-isopropylmalate/(R)-2-methylmalate dehydratase small subunit